ncbi:MAG: nucleotidyltransferase domain-containing protein [Rhodothermales bacterium]
MINPSIHTLLPEVRQHLADIYGDRLARVVLYGSQARGEAHAESDVDVLVVLYGAYDLYAETKRLVRLQTDLLDRHGLLVSFQPFAEEEYQDLSRPLMINVHAEGIEL